ncbi:MAG: YlxR family protein [Pseudonocardiales bacterium]|nr:YlxR family protein [Pseudonocardiales bacterium]
MARRLASAPARSASDERRQTAPIRTCVGCRSRVPVTGLLRVVAVDGVLTPDPRRRSPGRGAWLHPDPGCLSRAERRTAFPRTLRVPGPLDSGPVRQYVEQHVENTARPGIRPSHEDERQVDPS